MVTLREWAVKSHDQVQQDCELDKPELGTWPPYAFALLLIYFLQQMNNPVLPVLHEMVAPKPGLSEEIVHSDNVAQDKTLPAFTTLYSVSKEEALLLVKKLNSKYLGYTYSSSKFAGEQGLPVCCSICHQTGHDFQNCKEDSLEAFAYILPPMEKHFMNAIITFCHQIEEEWAASEEDITIRQQIVAEMETFIANEMEGAQLNVFGSSCNGFGLRKSDLDICLTFVNNKTGKWRTQLFTLGEAFNQGCNKNEILMERAGSGYGLRGPGFDSRRVQIIWEAVGLERKAELNGWSHRCADHMTPSIRKRNMFPLLRLQQLPLPLEQHSPMSHLERPEQPQHVIDGYETYFFEDLKRLPHIWPAYGGNLSTVGELWLQFLKFYVDFDFKSNVVSIRLQEPLSCFEKLWTSKCMAIEDPFELSHNLGAHISKKSILLKHKVYSKTFHSAIARSKASPPKLTSCAETEEF
uniref:Polymerase nucleotidyl transferase domain-containing protein n=1 Tax=Timema monikensis TaxID=170555 RepID=A0A7R9DZ82_9NEOP|nr:unnamed protein product [Timema monikensis]